MQVLINKARVLDKQSVFNNKVVDITITDGVIAGIIEQNKKSAKTAASIVADGKEVWKGNATEELLVSTGWVDVFADYREPGLEHKETIASGLAAAAAGGFTHVLLLPNTQPAISSKSVIQYVLGKAVGNTVSVHALGTVTANAEGKELAEMMDMHANGATAFTDGWKPIQNANLMLKALEYVKAFGGTVLQMPVDAPLAAGGLMNEGAVSTTLGMPGIPLLAETLMLYRDIELLRYTHSKLHVTGISSAESVAMIRKAKEEKLNISCSVTPYHLALTEDMLNTYDSAYKVTPPLRSEADRMALIKGLADGTIDCIATHHRPHEWDAKTKEFEYAADGMAVQEIAFNIVWDTLKDYLTIERIAEVLANAPKHLFGLHAGTIAKGNTATLTLFSATGKHTLTTATKKSAAMNNPFIGKALTGAVIGIFNNNKLNLNK